MAAASEFANRHGIYLGRRSTRLHVALGVISVAVLLSAPGPARGSEGRLDPTYGDGGLAITRLAAADREPAVEITVDGASAFVADGYEGVAVRLRQNGSLDRSFGQDGQFVVIPGSQIGDVEGRQFAPTSLTTDHRGAVLAFGSVVNLNRSGEGEGKIPSSPFFAAVRRYKADGDPDRSFGDGKGYVVSSFGLAPEALTGFPKSYVLAGQVDSRNRPVLVVGSSGPVAGCEGKSGVGRVPRAVVRLTVSGERDRSFGVAGVSRIFGAGESPLLGIDAEDQPAVGLDSVGSYAADCGEGSILYRFGRDGEPFSGFGREGMRVFTTTHLRVVEPSGAAVFSEDRGGTIEVARVGPNGTRERGFGRRGVVQVRLPRTVNPYLRPAAVDSRGRILLAGNVYGVGSSGRRARPRPSAIVVGRLPPDGRLDRSFGKGGWLFTRLPSRLKLLEVEAALDSKGRLLVAGSFSEPGRGDGNGGFVVARYLLGR